MAKYLVGTEVDPKQGPLLMGHKYEVYQLPTPTDNRIILRLVDSDQVLHRCKTCGRLDIDKSSTKGSCWIGTSSGFTGLDPDIDYCSRWIPTQPAAPKVPA
jgi:hypothetical protein